MEIWAFHLQCKVLTIQVTLLHLIHGTGSSLNMPHMGNQKVNFSNIRCIFLRRHADHSVYRHTEDLHYWCALVQRPPCQVPWGRGYSDLLSALPEPFSSHTFHQTTENRLIPREQITQHSWTHCGQTGLGRKLEPKKMETSKTLHIHPIRIFFCFCCMHVVPFCCKKTNK